MDAHDPRQIAEQLENAYKDQVCVVKLKHGPDHLASARMEIEDIYVDNDLDGNTLRFVGRVTGNSQDHAMVAIPTGAGAFHASLSEADNRAVVNGGEYQVTIIPDSAGF